MRSGAWDNKKLRLKVCYLLTKLHKDWLEKEMNFAESQLGNHGSFQFSPSVWLFVTPWNTARQAALSLTNSQSLLQLMFIESVMPSSCLILYCALLLQPLIFPNIRVFFNESTLCTRWPKYWSFSFSINPSNEYSGLISIRIDWFNLLAVLGTLKSLLQYHSSKALILLWSAFFMVQLSHQHMTTGPLEAESQYLITNTLVIVSQ